MSVQCSGTQLICSFEATLVILRLYINTPARTQCPAPLNSSHACFTCTHCYVLRQMSAGGCCKCPRKRISLFPPHYLWFYFHMKHQQPSLLLCPCTAQYKICGGMRVSACCGEMEWCHPLTLSAHCESSVGNFRLLLRVTREWASIGSLQNLSFRPGADGFLAHFLLAHNNRKQPASSSRPITRRPGYCPISIFVWLCIKYQFNLFKNGMIKCLNNIRFDMNVDECIMC